MALALKALGRRVDPAALAAAVKKCLRDNDPE
jgi:hypothetical protein